MEQDDLCLLLILKRWQKGIQRKMKKKRIEGAKFPGEKKARARLGKRQRPHFQSRAAGDPEKEN